MGDNATMSENNGQHAPSGPPVVPQVLSLLVCDQILIDRLTGKTSLIGLFTNVGATRYPVRHPHLCVFASLTDGRGKTPLELTIIDANEARPPVAAGKAVVEFADPRAIACLNLHFSGLTFPAPGEYRVQLKCNGALLSEARLHFTEVRHRQRS